MTDAARQAQWIAQRLAELERENAQLRSDLRLMANLYAESEAARQRLERGRREVAQ